jgi:NAD(P)-dependent dehydrogenase (short-subunit alcohol dehydrogenase family)
MDSASPAHRAEKFGAAAARAFGAEGAKLLLGARRVDRLKKVAAQSLKAGAAAAHFHELDVSKTSSVEKFISWARKKIDGKNLHVLINNAGGAQGIDVIAEGKDADWEAMIQSNVLGILRVTRAALPLLPRDTGASIINIGSVAGRTALRRRRGLLRGEGGASCTSPARCGWNCSARASASARWIRGWRKRNFRSCVSRATRPRRKSLRRNESADCRRHRGNSGLGRQPSGACQH